MGEDVNRTSQTQTNFPKVAIIILNWNGWKDTIECLESVFRIDYPNYQVIVVDNGSKNDSVERIKAWTEGKQEVLTPEPNHPLYYLSHPPVKKPIPFIEYDRKTAEAGGLPERERLLSDKLPKNIPHPLILIETGENLGFAGGNNVGVKYAIEKSIDYICILNNDTVVTSNFLTTLVATLKDLKVLGPVSPKILRDSRDKIIFYAGGWINTWSGRWGYIGYGKKDDSLLSGIHQSDFASGACFVCAKDLFQKIGLLDEDFFFSNEEMAFGIKAKKCGYIPVVNLDVVIYHKEGISYQNDSYFRRYFSTKYRLLCLRKYVDFPQKLLGYIFFIFSRIYKFFVYFKHGQGFLVKAEFKAIADFLRGRFGDYDRKKSNSKS